MSSCIMKTQDSDEEVDLEALRLAALKSRKPKYPCVNHNNLIPIVPVTVEAPDFVNTKIKKEKVSPTREIQDESKANKENKDEKASNCLDFPLDNDQDILSMDDKEEEDSLERLMDQLEAEISGKALTVTNKTMEKWHGNDKKESKKTNKTHDKEGLDDEVELVQVKCGKEPNAIIEIRESITPERGLKELGNRKSSSPKSLRSFSRRSRSKLRSRSRSPFLRERSYRRSRSPYWSRSPRRSRSPFRRSRSPYWTSRRTRSKSRTPVRRFRSPVRKRSPFSRFSRSRSISYGRRSPWSLSPRRRSTSPFYHDGLPPRTRNFNSPERSRRSFSPRKNSNSPRRRSRSPRRYPRNSPYRRSKSPLRRSRSPFRRASPRRSSSPFLRRSKSPFSKLHSPNRSPIDKRYSMSPGRRSLPKSAEKLSPKLRSKSPVRKYDSFKRSPGRIKDGRSLSPNQRKNRSPLRVVEKNKLDGSDKLDKPRERNRNERRYRSLSRENESNDRRPYRQKYSRRFSPSRYRKSPERQIKRSKSPKGKDTVEKNKEAISKQNEKEPAPSVAAPLDPVLEARKKKFESLGEVDPTVDKKINLKAIKESTENPDDDEDAITINLETNLWDESEESDNECESRFKSDVNKSNRIGTNDRTTLSFQNLGNATSKKINLNRPLEESRRDRFKRDRHDGWTQSRRNGKNDRKRRQLGERSEVKDVSRNRNRGNDKSNTLNDDTKPERKPGRKPIVWSSKNEQKYSSESKDNEVSTTQTEVKEKKSKSRERTMSEKSNKDDSNVLETDDFDKLISDFERELESDICISTKEVTSPVLADKEVKKPKIAVKKNLFEPKPETSVRKPAPRIVKISEAAANKLDKSYEIKNTNKLVDITEKIEVNESHPIDDGPEDYIEDDDFVLEVSADRKKSKSDEDGQSDLRAVLSRRRNERLTKAVTLQENMPTRLVQSAFQGLGNKKSKRQIREVQDTSEFPSLDKTVGAEGRRVLLLHREKNPVPSLKCKVPEVKPDTTIHQRFARSNPRRKRKLQKQLDPMEDVEQEEEDQEGFEVEEEKQFRRFRLKRNVTLSSQDDGRMNQVTESAEFTFFPGAV